MARPTWDTPNHLQPRLPARIGAFWGRFQRGGHAGRWSRRTLAVLLLLAAAVTALRTDPGEGEPVAAATRDLDVGATLTADDLRVLTVSSPPDGAIADLTSIIGATLAAPVRRGEILTDVRLVDRSGLTAGPGRAAVPVTLPDPAIADLLRPGMSVSVVALPVERGAGLSTRITDDAVVVSVIEPTTASGPGHDRIVVLSVDEETADAVTTAAALGAIALRFR